MPPIKFKLNQTYRSEADMIWRFSRWLSWLPSWVSERNHFSNSNFLCCSGAFHRARTFKMATMATIMDTILMEMSKMWKVTDPHTDEKQTMVNSPWHKLTWSKVQGELTIEDIQDGCCEGHRGYCNKMFLAILNLHGALLPPIKFWLNLTYHSGADEVWRVSRWPPWGPSQTISDKNDFNNSESLCGSDASHQVWAQSGLWFGMRTSYEEFHDGRSGGQLGCLKEFSSSKSSCLPPSFSLIRLTIREQMSFQDFQAGHHGNHLGS